MDKTGNRIIGLTLRAMATLGMVLCLGLGGARAAGPAMEQTIYVPVYSYIFYGNKAKTIDLTATLSIRNTDVSRSITITSVNFHDAHGKRVKEYLATPVKLEPLASSHYLVAESDRSGGLGASFLVTWNSLEKVSSPVVEAVMIGALSAQGISFVCSGQVVRGSSN